MNIVIVCDFAYPGGGAEKVAIDSSIGLSQRGHRVAFLAGVGPADARLAAAGVDVELLETKPLKQKSLGAILTDGLWSRQAAEACGRLLARLPRAETVVHIHAWQRALTASVLDAVRQSRLPTVLTLHEYGVACPNQGFFDYQRNEICERKALGVSCLTTNCDTRTYAHKLWRTARTVSQRRFAHFPDFVGDVIYLSELSRQVLMPYFNGHQRWHPVRNPIDMPRTDRVRAEDNGTFLFAGRLSLEKGPDLFCEAVQRAGVQGVVAGDGPMHAELVARYPGIRFLGWCDRAQIEASMRQARAIVFPSRWYEGQPLVIQEALALGLPAIVSDRTGAAEVIDPGVTGLHFRHMDADALHEAITATRETAPVADWSREAAARYWSDPPTMERHCAGLESVYARATCLAAPH